MGKKTFWLAAVIALCLAVVPVWVRGDSIASTRIKDIARLAGVRSNQLNGMGIVVGLNGSGDTIKTDYQIVANVLAKYGLNNLTVTDLKVKNVAAVIITATLPPYAHAGDTLEVQVSSMGDARSLQGGVLLQAPLLGADGKVYAVAQGPLYVGGYAVGDKSTLQQKNIPTVGVLPTGAIVEREIPMQMDSNGKLRWSLNNPDFSTATRLAKTINDNIANGAAKAVDMGMVEVTIPDDKKNDPIPFIAEIESLPVTPDGVAKVIINERTGTIIVGEKVRIASVAVTHHNIIVKITSQKNVSQPHSFTNGQTKVVDNKQVDVKEEQGRMIILPDGTTIGEIVQALNSVGTNPHDIIAILVAIKEAGALYGDLEFV